MDWIGSLLGIVGSILLAFNIEISGYAWIIFLISNFIWMHFAIKRRIWSLLSMQIGYAIIDSFGLYRWLIA